MKMKMQQLSWIFWVFLAGLNGKCTLEQTCVIATMQYVITLRSEITVFDIFPQN